MVFICQEDSFLKEYETIVVSVDAAKDTDKGNKKKKNKSECGKELDVVFENTVLFPEGGGQNSDRGHIECLPSGRKLEVKSVRRDAGKAIHRILTDNIDEALQVGQKVKQTVDWSLRFDHMQQHSGQHLISAVFENKFNNETLSWWMSEQGAGTSFIELERKMSENEVRMCENECNEAIRNRLQVTVNNYDSGDPELTSASTRGLPDDLVGPVRVISIDTLDRNMCCGTHVANLAQLQAVKLMPSMREVKGKFLLDFLVGGRVLSSLAGCLEREAKMTSVVNGGPDDHADLASKALKTAKTASKSVQSLLKELAAMHAEDINTKRPKFVIKVRKESDADYANVLISSIENKDTFLCIISGDEKLGPCQMVLTGKETDLAQLGQKIIKTLDGKGGGKGNRMNAKIANTKKLNEIETLLNNHFINDAES